VICAERPWHSRCHFKGATGSAGKKSGGLRLAGHSRAGTRRRAPGTLCAVGSLGYKLVESALKTKSDPSAGADFGKELQCRIDDNANAADGAVRYAQAGAGLTASDAGAATSSLGALSPAEAASEYSKLARQWPGRLAGGGVIEWLQAP
jgi:hypothetical protein